MDVYADFRQKVSIDVKDVIVRLIEKEIGSNSRFYEKNGKYYREYESGGGTHSWDIEEEITKDKFDYLSALKIVLSHNS